jgi:hypothetical protein
VRGANGYALAEAAAAGFLRAGEEIAWRTSGARAVEKRLGGIQEVQGMSSGIHHETEKRKSKEKKVHPGNPKPRKKCACGKGLGYMQDKCINCQKAANAIVKTGAAVPR